MILATSTVYFRVAGDKHYFTDILVGGIVGAATGYFFTAYQFKQWSFNLGKNQGSITSNFYF